MNPLLTTPRARQVPEAAAGEGPARLYRRYRIDTELCPEIRPVPPRFRVRVRRDRLLAMVLRELIQFRGALRVALSRPCVYGVFSRKVGGLAPREELCVGCLRCTVQHPEVVQIHRNPERARLGDAYLGSAVETILYEARTGRVPVRGAGYRGRFGGEGWDGMWTDMSEIVRPTRDGIHGREWISTAVDLGARPDHLAFAPDGTPAGEPPRVVTVQVPFVFDAPPPEAPAPVRHALAEAARAIETLAFLPAGAREDPALRGAHVVASFAAAAIVPPRAADPPPAMVQLEGWDEGAFRRLGEIFPESLICVRVPSGTALPPLFEAGVRVFFLEADYHGRSGGRFAMETIQEAHRSLVEAGVREQVTLLGGGGIVMAEHVPKAILCGLDAVALDTALWAALQARFEGPCRERAQARVRFPDFEPAWAVQRLKNLAAAWRDQLLEVLGAMGLREVRRLRGEVGRCMFQRDLEREAFAGIEGYEG